MSRKSIDELLFFKNIEELSKSYTTKELKKYLKYKKLHVSGNKAVLLERLKNYAIFSVENLGYQAFCNILQSLYRDECIKTYNQFINRALLIDESIFDACRIRRQVDSTNLELIESETFVNSDMREKEEFYKCENYELNQGDILHASFKDVLKEEGFYNVSFHYNSIDNHIIVENLKKSKILTPVDENKHFYKINEHMTVKLKYFNPSPIKVHNLTRGTKKEMYAKDYLKQFKERDYING